MKKLILSAVSALCIGVCVLFGCAQNSAFGLTKKQYAEVFGKTASVMLGGGTRYAGVSAAKYEADSDMSFVKSTGAFVYFLSEVYKNDKFTVSESPVKFTCSAEEETNVIEMLASYNKDAGVVCGEIRCETSGSYTSTGYISIEVDYDFETQTVNGFNLGQCNWDGSSQSYYMHCIYRDGKIYSLQSVQDDEYAQFVSSINAKKGAFAEKLKNTKDLKADFSEEYARSLQLLQ